MGEQVFEIESALTLFCTEVAYREQSTEPAPAGAVARVCEDIRRAVGEYESRARMVTERQVLFTPGQMSAHNPGDRIAIA